MEELQNTGVIQPFRAPTDFTAGAAEQIPYQEVCSDWSMYLPNYENQFSTKADFLRCVTEAALNSCETQVNRMGAVGELSDADEVWLLLNGYILDGKVQFSKRFTAKMSGTGTQGNSLQAVWDSIRNHGLLPEKDWTTSPTMTWDEHYAEIPQHLKDKAKRFTERFITQYQWVILGNESRDNQLATVKKYVKQAPVQIASLPIQGHPQPVADRGCGSAHSTIIYGVTDAYIVFDHYPPYLIKGSTAFCIPWAMIGVIRPKSGIQVDIAQYEGKCIEAPSGKAYVVKDGKRYESPDALTWYSCGYTYEMIQKVSQTVVDMIPRATENGGYLNYKGSQHEKMFDSMRAHRHQFSTWLG